MDGDGLMETVDKTATQTKPAVESGGLTYEQLRKHLRYDSVDGLFYWINARGRAPRGAVAGCVGANGYRYIRICGAPRLAHRLAWLYVHGTMLPDQIDHINRDRDDNRIANLRPASAGQNIANSRARCSSAMKGAYFNKKSSNWYSVIQVGGKTRYLGRFDSAHQANAAYIAAARSIHGDYAHG